MAREGRVFKTTKGNEVYRDMDTCLKLVKTWLEQNGEKCPSEERCKERLDEFTERFKLVEDENYHVL